MSSPVSSATLHVSRHSARRMVRQLHHHVAEQRQTVMECRNRAESMSASGIAHDTHVNKSEHPSPLCFVEVASEKDVKQSFIPYGPLSGITVAVSDALDVQEFRTRSGLDTPVFHHVARKEFPLISWLRRQGAQFVGKLSCRTPFALSEGTIFGPEKPASLAVTAHACDYAISCSLNGPSSVLCAVHHDMVGFKPTSQTFGTFTERFELTMPSMTVGLSARRVDDLMYLWQLYTASIDPATYLESTAAPTATSPTPADATSATDEAAQVGTEKVNASAETIVPKTSVSPLLAPEKPPSSAANGGDAHMNSTKHNWLSGSAVAAEPLTHPDETPKYARPEILDHSPYNYTVRDRRGHIADIDVGWRDYNAEATMADDFNPTSRPGFLRRLVTGARRYETPQVELAIGYPAEWIDRYCKGKYNTSNDFHRRITDAVYLHSALHHNQKLEIVPLAFDFSVEEAMEAVTVISHYELAKAFERLFTPASATTAAGVRPGDAPQGSQGGVGEGVPHGNDVNNDEDAELFGQSAAPLSETSAASGVKPIVLDGHRPAAPNRPNTFAGLSGVLEELPAAMVESIHAGQRLTMRDYNLALRVRDDVVRSTEEQFMDVDCFLTPLLSEPYQSGDVRSVRLTLPFQLAGNPILSMQVDPSTPVALVGELGRDAALMEDAFCFLQFVRGASPRWWRQKVFGDSAVASSPPAPRPTEHTHG